MIILFQRFQQVEKKLKHIPVLTPRFYHLKAYYAIIQHRRRQARKFRDKTYKLCKKQHNVYEDSWLRNNAQHWFDKSRSKANNKCTKGVVQPQDIVDVNTEWKEHVEDCQGQRTAASNELVTYTLPLPVVK